MLTLTPRQRSILRSIVKEYSVSGEAVPSQVIVDDYQIGCSPATVRNEMTDLEKEGFLIQPHISAGRIPSDKGLRYFVDELMEDEVLLEDERALFDARLFILQGEAFLSTLAHLSSAIVRDLTLLSSPAQSEVHFAGLVRLLKKPEFQEKEKLLPIIQAIEELENDPSPIYRLLNGEKMQIVIGEESNFTSKTQSSLIIGNYRGRADEEGFVAILGAKRMDYARNRSVIRYLRKLIEDHLQRE